MSKLCKKCGFELEETAKFCSGCGAAVEAVISPVIAPTNVKPPVVEKEAVPEKEKQVPAGNNQRGLPPEPSREKKSALPVILCVILAVAVVALLLVLRSCDGGKPDKSDKKKSSMATQPKETVPQAAVPTVRPAQPESTEPAPTEPAPTEPEPTEPAPDYMTHTEFMAADFDAPVTVECYVQATQEWWNNTINVYAQDRDGGYFIYEMKCSERDAAKLTPGTKIRVSGYKGIWAGEIEIMDATFEFVEGADRFVAEPLEVTELLGTSKLIDHQNERVCFKGVTISSIQYKNDEPGDDIYVDIKWENATYSFCVERYLTGPETDVYKAVSQLKIGDLVNIEGFLYWYEGVNTHITAVEKVPVAADLLSANQEKINKFLSNFAEQGFQGHPATAFDMLMFGFEYCHYNTSKFHYDQDTGVSYVTKTDMDTVLNDFFGMTVEPWQCAVVPGEDYIDRGITYVNDRYEYDVGDGDLIVRLAVAKSMKEGYNGAYEVEFDIYEVKSGTVKSSYYSMTAQEAAKSGALRRVGGGTATVIDYTRSTGKVSYQLVDYALDH